ncbi:MAG: biotin--[acetyl-CoA-carboxylase] ligase [Synergistaceae bacterium]|nr:biotin--[acetyl-CoA-carboxylase] ligase [Synergistaceae bacterium]
MATKEKLLELFESNKGVYFSGEDIARALGISRAAVWKAVKALQGEGYSIDAVTNKGYCLSTNTDIISPQGIKKYLYGKCADIDVEVVQCAASTNALVREKANAGAPEGCVVVANEQSAGRGRLGRTFYSPSGAGIYMSLLLRPNNYPAQLAARVTTIAAVAMCEAIEAVSDEEAQIKWINDIFIRGKKVCGILTEASFGLENSMLEYAVLGLGINVYKPAGGFPKELAHVAGAIFDAQRDDMKNRLAAEFLNRFMAYYAELGKTDYVKKYRSRCFVIGRHVKVVSGSQTKNALVLGIDDECRLLVRYDDGSEESIFSGEISIRF